MWLCWAGLDTPDSDLCWRSHIRGFDLEHTFRFCKQTLGWTTPRVRTPERADRWTWLILAAHTQLRPARPLTADTRLPWERRLPAAAMSGPAVIHTATERMRTPTSPTTEMTVSMTDQLLIVSPTVIPKYSFTSQKPASFT